MPSLDLQFECGETSLSVRRFHVAEAMMRPFTVTLLARSPSFALDPEAFTGRKASFHILSGVQHALVGARAWTGLCASFAQTRVEPDGLSTYEITLVPELARLAHREGCRLFEHTSAPDIACAILAEWAIEPDLRIDPTAHPRLELTVQYAETDLAFITRVLERAGIAFFFEHHPEHGSRLILSDRPGSAPARPLPLPFVDSPGQSQAGELEFFTAVHAVVDPRPGTHTVRDFDFRRPRHPLFAAARSGPEHTLPLEDYRFHPGAALVEAGPLAREKEAAAIGSAMTAEVRRAPTPAADDQGTARHDDAALASHTTRIQNAARAPVHRVEYRTSAIDLAPGVVTAMTGHPRAELGHPRTLLVTSATLEGEPGAEWTFTGEAHFADRPYHPPRTTPLPRVAGVQRALVVGPEGEEIHCDEFGRVRVQFPWDREGKRDQHSSTWMRVCQGWAGPGYGLFVLPRVGHEVLVSFLGGDPDHPVVTGRLYDRTSPVPYPLPDHKTVSTWKSDSSPGGDGFNEIKLDDAAGREHIYVQAERDMARHILRDEQLLVQNDRTRAVEQDEVAFVGRDRTRVVHRDEHTVTGRNQTRQVRRDEAISVGRDDAHTTRGHRRDTVAGHHTTTVSGSRHTTVGASDSTLVGERFSVTIAHGAWARLRRGMTEATSGGPLSRLVGRGIGRLLDTVFAREVQSPLDTAVDEIANGPLGDTPLGAVLEGPIARLREALPEPIESVVAAAEAPLRRFLGQESEGSDPQQDTTIAEQPTRLEMIHRKITLTSGAARVTLEGDQATFAAAGELLLSAGKKVVLQSDTGDVVLHGKDTKLNPDL
ncbi:MAG: type VI secretion system tip protein TssI/VgrG [Polyangiaceae bacterium]